MTICTDWLALAIGNSRLHWAWFQADNLQAIWDTQHLSSPLNRESLPRDLLLPQVPHFLPLYVASVVPSQTRLWQNYTQTKLLTLEQIPLKKLYSTVGIDRALAVLGAGETYGFPCLVIDAGTALTLTGVDGDRALVGGAILPGLKLQFQSLSTQTAALPDVNLPEHLPPRWAMTTSQAIASGIIYTILAGLSAFTQNWWLQFPESSVIFTGGDSVHLINYLSEEYPVLVPYLKYQPTAIFAGMRTLI